MKNYTSKIGKSITFQRPAYPSGCLQQRGRTLNFTCKYKNAFCRRVSVQKTRTALIALGRTIPMS